MRNKGNNALLQAAMEKLGKYWPNASYEVITLAPNLLRMYFPYAYPVSPDSLNRIQSKFNKYQRFTPRPLLWLIFELREEIWHRWTMLKNSLVNLGIVCWVSGRFSKEKVFDTRNALKETDSSDINFKKQNLTEAISGFDLLVTTGGGYMCDSDKTLLLSVLNRLEAAIIRKIPTFMVGQGIGPLEDPELLSRAREILPGVDFILYRNLRNGLPLLHSLGILPERIILTGDDAIEMTYRARSSSWGNGIGVSLRVAHYTQVEKQHIDNIRKVLHRAAKDHKSPLIAVPISSAHHESDITFIKQILAGYIDSSIGWRKLDPPLDTINRVRKCRVVVTGTYHGAIFALAQGIPVVGLAKSAEYFNKLSELSDEFGPGCQVLQLDDKCLAAKLKEAIDNYWSSAEMIRPSLLEAASRQIEWQNSAYQRIYELVTSRILDDKN